MNNKFFIQEYVRWSDVDYAGLICYGAYLRFFEMAETELFRAAGLPYGKVFEELDFWLPRVQLHCDFRSPAFLDDLLIVEAFIGHLGNKSLKLNFEVYRGEEKLLLAEGYFVMVATSRKDFKSIALPALLKERLAGFSR